MMKFRWKIVLLGLLLLAGLVQAGNWPQWRGPNQNGSSEEKNLPTSWSETENVRWSVPLPGVSAATPIVWGERVFVSSTQKGSDTLLGICIDAAKGEVLWQKEITSTTEEFPGSNNSASPSPVTDGERVYFLYGNGAIAGFDYEGRKLWQRNLAEEYGSLAVKYGYSSSPLIYQDKIVVMVLRRTKPYRGADSEAGELDAFVLAVDKVTGKNIWKQTRTSQAIDESRESYTTPIVYEGKEQAEIIVMGGDLLTGHDPQNGSELWRLDYLPEHENYCRLVATPAIAGEMIYANLPRYRPLLAVKAAGEGTRNMQEALWKYEGLTADVCSPLYYQGNVYILNGVKKVLTCLDAKSGNQKWQEKLGGAAVFRASPTGADGKIYCINENGQVVVLAAGDEYKELSRIEMGEGPCKSTIAVAGGRLFIRTGKNLYCIASPDAGGGEPAKPESVIAGGAEMQKLAEGFQFTEGPARDGKGNVYFSDIPNNRIHVWSVEGKLSTFREDSGGANGLYFDKEGILYMCEGKNSRRLACIDPSGKETVLADSYDGKKLNSPNDLWVDKKGGIYFSDPRYGKRDNLEQDGEHVYYLSPDRSKLTRVVDDMVRPNGLIGTADGRTLYVADNASKQTYVYQINPDGTLSDKKLFAAAGSDGMTIDNRGNVYLTGKAVSVYNSRGEKIETIEVPQQPANLCFGGVDKDTLFITARTALYAIKMRVKGL